MNDEKHIAYSQIMIVFYLFADLRIFYSVNFDLKNNYFIQKECKIKKFAPRILISPKMFYTDT